MKFGMILLFILALSFMVGCEKEIQYVEVNHTIIQVINNSVECVKSEYICKCDVPAVKECTETKCDTSALTKCRLDSARAMAETDYYKKITAEYFMNNSFEDLQMNYTDCLSEKEDLENRLRLINESLG